MNKKSITSIMLAGVILAGSTGSTGSTIYRNGKRTGRIVESPYGVGGVDVYDDAGRRIGTGRRSPYDDSIRIYDPRTFRPLYEIRPDRRTR